MDARRGLEGDSLARRIVLLIRNAADSASLVDWRVHAYRKSHQMLTMRSTPLGFIWATSVDDVAVFRSPPCSTEGPLWHVSREHISDEDTV